MAWTATYDALIESADRLDAQIRRAETEQERAALQSASALLRVLAASLILVFERDEIMR